MKNYNNDLDNGKLNTRNIDYNYEMLNQETD